MFWEQKLLELLYMRGSVSAQGTRQLLLQEPGQPLHPILGLI